MERNDLEALELMIDKTSLTHVLDGLVEICAGKADHIATNWQDATLSGRWQWAANTIERIRGKMAGSMVPGIAPIGGR